MARVLTSRISRAFSLALLLGSALVAQSAQAWPYYFEFGGNVATYSTPEPLLLSTGKASSSSASAGIGVPLTFAVQLQSGQGGLLVALGLQQRYLTGTSGADQSFSVFPTSPILRLEFWRLVFGVGYTTWIWNGFSFDKNGSLDSMLTLEAQMLFPITPEIDFGLQASRESFKSERYGAGPDVTEFGAFFRLNFGFTEALAGERRKFKGWRYPFGTPLR